ncbi:hypothetical protein TNCV_3357981 [Trichonephila clavipes]|nr:hypothetical protein TNCV_3357981 [Trichonephila clavipes]
MALLVQTALECFCGLRMNRTREVEGDFCGLLLRRDEERVVDPPLVFKRALEGENLKRALNKGGPRLEWSVTSSIVVNPHLSIHDKSLIVSPAVKGPVRRLRWL